LSFFAACSNGEDLSPFTLDARSGSAQRLIPPSADDQHFYLVPFSAPNSNKVSSSSYFLKVEAQSGSFSKLLAGESTDVWENIRVSSVLMRTRKENKRYSTGIESLQSASKIRATAYPSYTQSTSTALPTTLSIFSPFDGEINQTITGTLRGKTSRAAIYVDSRDSALVSDDEIDELLDSYDRITLPRLHSFFGTESDVDENNTVILFLASESQIGSSELGFFRPADLLPNGAVPGAKSNQAEIVFSRLPDKEVPVDLVNATLAHETFHLINFSNKTMPLYNSSGGSVLIVEDLFPQ
jgi:hypothetical protein